MSNAFQKMEVPVLTAGGWRPKATAIPTQPPLPAVRMLPPKVLSANAAAPPLPKAAGNGLKGVVSMMPSPQGVSVTTAANSGRPPLHKAAGNGRKEVVISSNMAAHSGRTALHKAVVGTGHKQVVGSTSGTKGVSFVNAVTNSGKPAQHKAVENGRKEVTSMMPHSTPHGVSSVNEIGWTPLHNAAFHGHKEAVRMILDTQEDVSSVVNAVTKRGRTALHLASEHGHNDVVRMLLDTEGVTVNVAGDDGSTALHLASEHGHKEVVRMILDTQGVSALRLAVLEVVRTMLDTAESASVNARNDNGWTALHLAASHGHTEVVRMILDAQGVSVNAAANDGATALQVAALNGHKGVVKELLGTEGIDLALEDNSGHTALHYAQKRSDNKDIVSQLIFASGTRLSKGGKSAELPPMDVVIIGGGPVGLSLALLLGRLKRENKWSGSVQVYEARIEQKGDEGKVGGTYHWRELADGNRRREQVVTLQNDIVTRFPKDVQELFDGETVWLSSRNVAIRSIEDRILARLQKPDLREHVKVSNLPPEIRKAVRSSRGSAPNEVYQRWVNNLPAHVIVAADGGSSLTRQCANFSWQNLGAAEGHVEADYAMGLALANDVDGLRKTNQAWNVVATLAQTRYLLNSEDGKRGYLNIRLTQKEFEEVSHENNLCSQSAPCMLYDAMKKNEEGVPVYRQSRVMEKVIKEGCRLFGLDMDEDVTGVVAFKLVPSYANKFIDGRMCLVGDAAMSHHFWPGRGLNTGLRSVLALANALETSDMDSFEQYMQQLRRRELQGRSLSMLRQDVQFPAAITKMRTEKDIVEALKEIDPEQERAKFTQNVKLWRNVMEARGSPSWPHKHLSDEVIEDKMHSRKKPLDATVYVLNRSGLAVSDDGHQQGWPIQHQRGEANAPAEGSGMFARFKHVLPTMFS